MESTKEAITDLHRRLADVGYPVAKTEVEQKIFGTETKKQLSLFQKNRGLRVTGHFDEVTFSTLIEAGYQLGDRNLYLHSPMIKGDDVADLQFQLSSLGFDTGRIDGVFGPDTAKALADFQHNTGLAPDGIAGTHTVISLKQLTSRESEQIPVAKVREIEKLLQANFFLKNRKIAIGQFGSCAVLANAIVKNLRNTGAQVMLLDHPDENHQAKVVNNFDAEVYLGIDVENDSHLQACYFSAPGFQSEGGLRLAHRCVTELSESLFNNCKTTGMRIPILRATKMPAVFCVLGPPQKVVKKTNEIAIALSKAITAWVEDPASLIKTETTNI
tara:strand:- start:29 stop:1015 length:987 start_codon:yes stop_codon:yes gene_type:complete